MVAAKDVPTLRISKLWLPLQEEEVLVEGEVIHYKERQHWFSIFAPMFTSIILVLALIMIASWPDAKTDAEFAFIGFTFIFAAWFVHDKLKDWPKPALYVLGVFVFFVVTNAGIDGLAALGIVFVVVKLGYESIARAYFRTIYLTNRRIIMAESPLTRNISSIALGRITDISVSQSQLGAVLNYFEVRLETAGQDQALNKIPYIKYSDEFYQDLIELSTQEVRIERELE